MSAESDPVAEVSRRLAEQFRATADAWDDFPGAVEDSLNEEPLELAMFVSRFRAQVEALSADQLMLLDSLVDRVPVEHRWIAGGDA